MVIQQNSVGLTPVQSALKRCFDMTFSIVGLVVFGWLILIAILLASFDTRANGLFSQLRVGRNGLLFKVFKIRTMRRSNRITTTVTTSLDPRITALGRIFRQLKIDELPQLYNIVIGDMSFVGPRPDVQGFYDTLEGDDRIILSLRPGLTGPATLKYKNEEEILSHQKKPEKYNKEVLFVDKVRLNKAYIMNYSFLSDIKYIIQTII